MLDTPMRRALEPALGAGARRLEQAGIGPGVVTGLGLGAGLGCAAAAALAAWPLALGLWLFNRLLDGLDGPLARLRGSTDLGGMLDFVSDFVVYAGFPLGVAIAIPDSRLAACALLASYLVNNVALLSFSSLVERRGLAFGDERSIRFTTGLTEGTETIVCYVVVCLVPEHAGSVFWVFAGLVMVTVAQRIALAFRTLG